MAYMLMGQPKPVDATGVAVTLTVFDPNGNTYEIGSAVSNSDGKYSFEWIPQVPGEYKLTATFAGSESYWPSSARTAVFVDEALPPPVEPPVEPEPLTDTYVMVSAAGIIIAIVIAGVIIVLLLRKR